MKTDRKISAEAGSTKASAAKKARSSAPKRTPKSNGKRPLANYEYAPIGIVECSPEGRHINVNEEFCRMLGYEKGELIGIGLKEITHEDDYPIDLNLHQQLVAGKIPFYRLEKRYVRKDGEILWVELTRSLVHDVSGDPLYTIGVVLDISERKHVERVLRDSSERLRLATEAARMFTWELDFKTQIYTLADNFDQVLGFSAGLLPKNSVETVYRLSPSEDLQTVMDISAKAIENHNDLKSLQFRVINPENGQVVWLEVNAKIVYDNEGRPKRMFGVAQNITERKLNEHSLAESARQQAALYQFTDQLHRVNSLEDVFNASLDAILNALQCDRASILLFDETDAMHFVAWRGLSDDYRKATEGHSPWKPDETPPEPVCMNNIDTAELSDSLKAVVKAEGIGSLAFIPLVSNGKLIGKFMTYYNAPHVFSEAEVDLSLAIAHQLAFGVDRNLAEEKLRQSEERFRTLANAMPSIVWTAAPDGTITYANNQWFRYVGITPEENAKGWPELVLHPDDYERCVNEWTRALETVPDEYLIEVRNRRHDGQYRWFQTRAVPARDASGKAIAWYGVTTDIHERIEAEQRLVLLAEISELVRKSEHPNELMYAVSKAVGEHLQVKRCLFNEIDVENDLEIVHRDYCRGVESVAGIHKISDYSSVTSAEMAAGITVVNHDSKVDPRTAPDYERSYVPHGERAYVAVPMMRKNRWVASLWVSDDVPHQWSKEEVSLLETVAERTWIAIEKLRINEALRASEALYRTIARSIPGGGVYVLDKDMRYLVADGAVTEAFGLSREMLEGNTVSEVFPKEASARMIERLQRNFMGETISYETEHNGRVYWTQQAPLNDSVGQAIIVTLDITERKRVEEALRQSEERFVQFMEHLPGLAWIKDMQGRYVYANAAAEKAFGTPREKLYGKTDEEIFPPEVATQFKNNDERALLDEKGVQVIETLEHDDGVLHYSLVSKFPIPGLDGNKALIGGTAFDITDHRRAEEALRESDQRYRNLFDLVPIAVYTCDGDGLIQEYNHRAVELWGREPARNDPKEKYCGSFKIYYPNGRFMPHEECPMSRVLSGETLEPHELEILVERQDGVRRNVLAHPFPIKNQRGEIVEAINCLYDITERKQAEEALQQLNLQLESRVQIRTEKLNDAIRALREEIKERKQVEAALDESRKRLQILSQRLVEVQEEERRAIARELHDRVGQILSALNINLVIIDGQILEDSKERIGSRLDDSLHLVSETITLVRDVMSNLRPAVLDDYGLEAALQSHIDEFIARYEIKVLLERPAQPIPRLGPSIEMTFLRIAQEALINIARHAHASQVTLTLRQEDDSIRMTVQDNGSGIESWQEANRPGSHGLTIMRERAEAFGGNLKVTSMPGKGTKIEVSIPFENDNQSQVKEAR